MYQPVRLPQDRKEVSTIFTWIHRIFFLSLFFVFGRVSTSFISSKNTEDIQSSHSAWLNDIEKHSFKNFSQGGQDGIIDWVFENIGTTNKYYVEFGFNVDHWGGSGPNTENLHLKGWKGLLLD